MITVDWQGLSEVERYMLRAIGAGAMRPPEGKMADTAMDLVEKGLADETSGFFTLTEAGISQLCSNR